MFTDIGIKAYFFNQIIFFVIFGLFCFVGFKLANRSISDKKKNKKIYHLLILSIPYGFLLSFFLIDAVWHKFSKGYEHMQFGVFFVYWFAMSISGGVIGFLTYLYLLKKYKIS